MATIVNHSEAMTLGTESEIDRVRRLVKMVETFIPIIDYCTLGVDFVDGSRILMCSICGGYCLFDRKTRVEHNFKTKEELAQKARTYLAKYEVENVTISGCSLLKE
jgi:hypothetical protein